MIQDTVAGAPSIPRIQFQFTGTKDALISFELTLPKEFPDQLGRMECSHDEPCMFKKSEKSHRGKVQFAVETNRRWENTDDEAPPSPAVTMEVPDSDPPQIDTPPQTSTTAAPALSPRSDDGECKAIASLCKLMSVTDLYYATPPPSKRTQHSPIVIGDSDDGDEGFKEDLDSEVELGDNGYNLVAWFSRSGEEYMVCKRACPDKMRYRDRTALATDLVEHGDEEVILRPQVLGINQCG
ncbi:MAG: hypothetical protein Q9216_000656 [Gyalolechia sp. 2 TL-2023]